MLELTSTSDDVFVGIDHSVNKSAVCIVDRMGRIIKAAYFTKIPSSQKYTFAHYNSSQVKIYEKRISVVTPRKTKKCPKPSSDVVTEIQDFILNTLETSSVPLPSDGRLEPIIYDDGEYTRTIMICEAVREFISQHTVGKKVNIVIEGYAYHGSGNVVQIAENVGHLKIGLVKSGWPFKLVQPNSIKKVITGFGGGGKYPMEYALDTRYMINFNNDDLNDAYAISEYCRLDKLGLIKKT